MLVLKITDEREKIKKVKGVFRKKIIYEKNEEIKRYSLNVNGKTVVVLELPEVKLESEDVLTLLKVYEGRVLTSKENVNNPLLQEYLFDPKEYYQRAVLSSLINQMKTVNKEWKNVNIKVTDFLPFKELFEIVKISKSVVLITEKSVLTEKFINDCYYEFGAIVTIKGDCIPLKYDIFLNLEEIDNNGKLMIEVKGKDFLLYPDMTYFQENPEYQKLLPFNIEHNIICAAFSGK